MKDNVYIHKRTGNRHTCVDYIGCVAYFVERDEVGDIVSEYSTEVLDNVFSDPFLFADLLLENI